MKHGDFQIRELESWAEFQQCVALQRHTWGESFSELVPASLLKTTQRIGGVTAGAFDAEHRLAAFVFGLTGIENARPVHWSDMLAVRTELRSRGLGEALKRYQRSVLLGRGVERMYWTFDPLESRNAHLNFERLGAVCREYRRDYYGESDSPLHRGIGTDRLIVLWQLNSARVERSLEGAAALRAAGAVRVPIPSDIQALKGEHAELALDWRLRTRAALEELFGQGYWITGFARGEEIGHYLLEREPFAS